MSEFEDLSCEDIVSKLVILFHEENQDELDDLFDWWLYAFNPETRASAVTTNATFLRDAELREAVLTKAVEFYEPSIFLEALNILSFLGQFRLPLFNSHHFRC